MAFTADGATRCRDFQWDFTESNRADRPSERFGLAGCRSGRPALMVIGEVVALRNEMKWFGEGIEYFRRSRVKRMD